ncbi:DUF533 domain-containing protein [Rhodospirillaceae bacterium SYSU D60014]|uniref:tellurite resistance TerB family protein n=1 Tax=Virgifigura deserti TaxID=2268457 RepID=UPI000E66B5CD
MANLQRILGALMSTGVGGRSRRGPSFGKAVAGGGLLGGLTGGGMMRGAGLAALGTLAYRAYQNYQAKQGGQTDAQGGAAAQTTDTNVSMDDREALLLIRGMIAAANADGKIDADERQRIASKLQEAGADQGDRAFIEREMSSPIALDELLRQVNGQEEAEEFYLASELAIEADTDAERSYLRYLADRLKIPQDRIQELNRLAA